MPARRLLVYEVKQGWVPLCEFLGVEAPREPFPRLNERDQFPKLMRRAMLSELPGPRGSSWPSRPHWCLSCGYLDGH